jgi:hypothetical protein
MKLQPIVISPGSRYMINGGIYQYTVLRALTDTLKLAGVSRNFFKQGGLT